MTNFEININVHAPELAAAINKLAESLPGKAVTTTANQPAAPIPQPTTLPTPGPLPAKAAIQPFTPSAPAQQTAAAPASAPVQQQAPVAAPAAYTLDQLTYAAGELVRSGKQPELFALLGRYGVQSMPQLAPGQYDSFATDLRAMGARI